MGQDDNRFYAYEIHERSGMPITAAPVGRDWMDATDQRFAYRCLPLAIANQAGWLIHNPAAFTAWWDGRPGQDGVKIDFDPGCRDQRISSHFGAGTFTVSLPYLFRTPPSVNLWIKGPSNWIKDGAQALEGIVETDWLSSTFTMNWKLTRPFHPVRFERDEPICMVVPVPRGLAESLEPVCQPLEANAEVHRQYQDWTRSRAEFLTALKGRQPEAVRRGWQKDYTRGLTPEGGSFAEHQTRLQLKEFARPGQTDPVPEGQAVPARHSAGA